jgi:Putative DNA-binding domain
MFDWLPDTEDRLREMLDHGLLSERHTVDFKEQLDSGKGANKEHARDLAQFGPDGGVLIVGVNDDGQLTPIQLAGQRERIDQIARTIPDPPMHVRIEEIPAAGQPAKGYLLVVVAPSPDAPHQVDGRYYGRGDTTKHVLSDAESRPSTTAPCAGSGTPRSCWTPRSAATPALQNSGSTRTCSASRSP